MSKKVYTTSNVQQLIDLNEDLTNFKLKFTLSSKNGEEFAMVIADQHTIDNSPNDLEFKRVKNTISGTIVSDKDVFQNHFLILKSAGEKPAEVEVVINKKEIPPNPESKQEMEEEVEHERNMRAEIEREEKEALLQLQREEKMKEQFTKKINNNSTWVDIKLIIVILICILVGIFIYNVVSNKPGITTDLTGGFGLNSGGLSSGGLSSGVSTGGGNMFGLNQNLFRKLNNSIPI